MSEVKMTAERAEEIYMAMIEEAKKGLAIKPCPCCGNTNLHIGLRYFQFLCMTYNKNKEKVPHLLRNF